MRIECAALAAYIDTGLIDDLQGAEALLRDCAAREGFHA